MGKAKQKTKGVAALIIIQTALTPLLASAQMTEPGLNAIKLPSSATRHPSIEKDSSIEAILKPQELTTTPITPVSLAGIKIPGVNAAALNLLQTNHFVVINNTNFETMADVYRDNRLKGKPNFVTLDCIVHPYFATTNGMIAAVIEEQVMPQLKQVLAAMTRASIEDYRNCEDAEVKDDIQRNLAFLIVAQRLLDPALKLPDMGGATDLSDREMRNIEAGFKARSDIFDREENFQAIAPMGWFAKREKLSSFYRCAQWISRMDFPLTDVTDDSETGSGNLFRRSVLLFRALDRSTIAGKPAAETWQRLVSVWELFATSSIRNRQKTLLYTDFKASVPSGNQDLKSTLMNLASPFFRTKLLLSVRKSKPVGLGATSIFDLEDTSGASDQKTSFRLMPLIEDPEMPWLRARASTYADDDKGGAWCPLALLVLHARGAQAATNILYNGVTVLQPDMNKLLPELERLVAKPRPGQPATTAWERSWQILNGYFKQFPPEVQAPLKTDLWLSRHLESAFSGWVDAHLAFSEVPAGGNSAAANIATPAATPAAPAAASTTVSAQAASPTTNLPAGAPLVKPANFHYLEPVPAVFRAIESDAKTLQEKLTSLGYFPQRYEQRLNDFIRLCQRLAQIADKEIASQPTTPIDFKLLAGIDYVLDQISSPVAGSLCIVAPTPAPAPTLAMPSNSLNMIPGAPLTSGSSILKSGRSALTQTTSNILSAASTSSGKAATPAEAAAAKPVRAAPVDSIYKHPLKSANLVLGKPGLVMMICQTSQGPMLVRGGVYTFYEVSGSPIKAEHLKRKLQFDLFRPPVWARLFDIVQENNGKEPLLQKNQ